MKIKHQRKYCIGCHAHKFLVGKNNLCVECNHKRQHINTLIDNTKSEKQMIFTLNGQIEPPRTEKNKMNLKEMSKAYEPPKTKNIADLEKIPTSVEVKTEEFTKKDGETFEVDTIEVESGKYRVPKSVIAQLKQHLGAKPDLEFFKVSKTGSGLDTEYTVIPL